MGAQIGKLHLVPTPIGNLGDITLRAIETLRKCSHIVAEDTRRTRKLLTHFGVDGSRLSRLDAHASDRDLERVVGWLLAGEDVALVTDAGTPTISDPGMALVCAARDRDLAVIALAGASAVTVAVSVSGLVDGPFFFLGFVPRSTAERARTIRDLSDRSEPCVLFEAPQRTAGTLRELADAMPGRRVAVARELTKLHEQIVQGTLAEVAASDHPWKGEITIVLGVWTLDRSEAPTDEEVDARIDKELGSGVHTRTIADRVAAWSGRPRRDVYARVLERKRTQEDTATPRKRQGARKSKRR